MQLKALADVANIDYKETMADYNDKDEIERIKRRERIAAKIDVQAKLRGKTKDKGDMLQQDVAEMLVSQEQEQEMPQQEMAPEAETMAPEQGIMAKEQM
jgi:hypothetical protein